MKAKYLSLLAVPFLFAACQEEVLVNAPTFDKEGQVPVQITLGTPDAMNVTRAYTHTDGNNSATLPESSAKGALNNVDWTKYDLRYILEIYDTDKQEDGDNTIQIGDEKLAKERIYLIAPDGGSVSCAPRLTPNRGYQFVVWADIIKESGLSGEVPLSREDDATWKAVADNHYNTNGIYDYTEVIADPSKYVGLKNITINDEWTINDETRDAYFVSQYEVVTTATSLNLTLKRPFGKLRVVTTDIEDLKLGTYPQWTKISYNATRPAAFNAFSKVYSEEDDDMMVATDVFEAGLIYYANESSDASHAYEIDNENKTLFTDYIFGKEGEQTSVQFTLASYEGTDANSRLIHEYAFSTDIPVQRNYLTTLQGNVLTTATDIEIKVDPIFEGNIHFDVEDDGVMMDEEGNYIIVNKNGLLWLAQQVNSTVTTRATASVNDFSGKTVKLACDIDLQGAEWTPIGNKSYPFKGTFDAQKNEEENYTISNFKVTEQEGHAGLFGRVHVGTVKNLNVKDVEIVAHHYAGAIVGQGYVKMENCNVENVDITLTPKWLEDKNTYDWGDKAGAVLGQNGEGASFYVKDCSAKNVNINGYRDLGGIIGMAHNNNTVSGNSVENITIVQYTAGYTPYDNGNPADLETLGAVVGRRGTNLTYEYNDDAIDENKVVIVKTAGEEYPGYYVDANGNYCVTADGGMDAVRDLEGVTNVSVIVKSDVSLDISAWDANEYSFGDANTQSYVIDLEGHTLTFNQKDSDWNNIAANNASMTIKNGHITSSGHNDGPWNRHDLNFNCPITLIDITTDKAIALKNNGTLTNVTITDANTSDTYALWIQPKGQTVTLDGCTIDMLACTDGRGIKIDNQYVDGEEKGEAKVTLDVSNTTFKTEEKAAILVKTTVGADITLSNVNIDEVVADNHTAVWVDADAAASFGLVNVTGGYKALEGNNALMHDGESYVVATTEGLKAIASLTDAGSGNNDVKLAGDIDMTGVEWTPIAVDGYHGADIITVDGQNAVITGLSAPLFAGGFAGGSGIVIKNLTIKDSKIVSANETGSGAFIESSDSQEKIYLENCHLLNSSVTGSRTGGLVGWTSGYSNVNDGPVKTYVTLKDCSVVGCTITGSSVGGLNGHAGSSDWTYTTIERCIVMDNVLSSTDEGGWRVGVVVGTANIGEVTINNITASGNTLSQTGKTAPATEGIRTYYGRAVLGNTGKLTIDGNEYVAEGIWKDAQGNVFAYASTADDVTNAISKGATTINVNGSFRFPNNSTTAAVKFIGNETAVLDMTWGAYWDNATLTFEGVNIKTTFGKANGNGSDYAALYSKNVTYNKCNFDGPMLIGRDGAKFNECTFNVTSDYIRTYGMECSFNQCTFNTKGKALLIYSDGGNGAPAVSVTGCKFYATQGAKAGAIANQNCAAIEIHNYGYGVTLTTSGNTIEKEGEKFSGEWRIKTYETRNADSKIIVNGTEYTTLALDGKTMTIDKDKNITVQE